MFDVERIRQDFPILSKAVWGHPLCYLDNAATTQVPEPVLQTVLAHYRNDNANVHRGAHRLAVLSTDRFEQARETVARFINAPSADGIVFTKGTTDGINIVAAGLEPSIRPGDRILVGLLEHHSNFVPWQQLCRRTGAVFEVVGLTETGDLDLEALGRALARPARLVAMTCCSNVLGTMTPVRAIVAMAHAAGALCLLDGAQVMRHALIDVQDLGCDYLCFSGHKLLAPTGVGVLYGSPRALDLLAPAEYGGEMVDVVGRDATSFAPLPLRLEAGTPNYVGAIALGSALGYLEACGRQEVARREDQLLAHAEDRLSAIPGLRIAGTPRHRSGCLSFTIDGVHPFDLCTMVDKLGIALRSGNNCAQPLLREWLGVQSVSRLSVAFYNTPDEIDRAGEAIERVIGLMR